MSSSKAPPPHDTPDAKPDLLAQFADEKSHVQLGSDGTINYRSPWTMASMAFGGPLTLPRKEDSQQSERPAPPPSYSTATGQQEPALGSSRSGKRTNALGKEIEDGNGISGWWERRKERKAEEKARSAGDETKH